MRMCKVEGCDKKHRTKGYCARHYHQLWRYGEIIAGVGNRLDPNKFIIEGNICLIYLWDKRGNKKAEAIVDAEDYSKVVGYKWYQTEHGYVATNGMGGRKLQHLIMGIDSSRKIQPDHRDRNKLNNRKLNLRLSSSSQNGRNRVKPISNTSGYKGVQVGRNGIRWQAIIRTDTDKGLYLGMFDTKIEAAKAYNKAALKYHGEFAKLNHLPPIRR